ncbi:MAG: nucleotidyltransferase family protein [Proteobacteria bacterium]|jgi:molybdenum cofactor cytidylyltransferase|nr:nucleotidyltransferase family protein [Pseudomonadota bacterium]
MRIVGIMLAAGAARRFGGAKLLAAIPDALPGIRAGTGVATATAMHLASAMHLAPALTEVVAVLRPGDDALAAALAAIPLRIVECARAGDGMGASLACGVGATSDADGWVVALADMPWVSAPTIAAVAAALAAGEDIAAPAYRGVRGHPVGFARRHGAALAALSADAGARDIIAAHRDHVAIIGVDDAGILRDVDTPADLGRA